MNDRIKKNLFASAKLWIGCTCYSLFLSVHFGGLLLALQLARTEKGTSTWVRDISRCATHPLATQAPPPPPSPPLPPRPMLLGLHGSNRLPPPPPFFVTGLRRRLLKPSSLLPWRFVRPTYVRTYERKRTRGGAKKRVLPRKKRRLDRKSEDLFLRKPMVDYAVVINVRMKVALRPRLSKES